MNPILITQNIVYDSSRNQFSDQLDHRWIKFLGYCGFDAIPISNASFASEISFDYISELFKLINPCGLVLSGGNTPGQFTSRDNLETNLLDYCKSNGIPILGVCRGMQIMGLYAGSELIQVVNHAGTKHALSSDKNIIVNSFHNYALSHCPPDFHLRETADDGIIESIAHNTLPWLACMWHPERVQKPSNTDVQMVASLFSGNINSFSR